VCTRRLTARRWNAIVTFDRRAALPLIRVPTLLVAGEHDRNAPPAVMQKMAGQIAGSRYAELPGIGHLQNLEAPDEFDALVLGFLADTAGRPGAPCTEQTGFLC
jgi:3-oxoadipate enol-lactonase